MHDPGGGFEAIQLRHGDIHEYEVRLEGCHALQYLVTVGGFADNLHPLKALEQGAESSPDQVVIVGGMTWEPQQGMFRFDPMTGASKSLTGYPQYIQNVFRAMQTYGLIVADNGSDMYVTGAMDVRWNNDELNPAFRGLTAADFDVILLGWR